MQTLWILGDQLLPEHPGLKMADQADTVVLFIESKARAAHVKYHQQKLVLIYAAMRHYAAELRAKGWTVDYYELVPKFEDALKAHVAKHSPSRLRMMEPNDWAMTEALPKIAKLLGLPVETIPTTQFLVPRAEFKAWAAGRKSLLMEQHYRKQRQRLKILVDAQGEPEGGEWNFDAENRQTYPHFAKAKPSVPTKPRVEPDTVTRQVIEMVRKEFPDHPGDARGCWLPVTREGALVWLKNFVRERLESFGPWEDVMVDGEPVLFHSVLSPLLNIGLLTPLECVQAAVAAYEAKRAPLESVEGFVRQIIGWREFVNGVYWTRMPDYTGLNALGAERPLPSWIYTGKTDLACVRSSIEQALALGYNHHIQRLMVLGNFFLLGGYRPAEVYRWYLEMYVDAYDWVMAANVIGMILFADGGYMSTKPYAAGAGYISKMSNHCKGCRYKPDVKIGPDACPFNYLYWNFFAQHEARFAKNPRVGMMLKTWQKKSPAEQTQIRAEAATFLKQP
jgi:deoxyribodipyrimidine photolyase-related protein